MVDASEAIPEEGIFLVEAFEYIFRVMTPNWRELEVLASKPHLHGEERPEVMRRSDAEYDCAQLEANKWLRDRIGERSIFARICGPNGQLRRLTSEGWENVGFAENGISANFVSPDDLMNPGPATEIDGVRYPVFFLRDEFEKLVQSSFGSAEPPTPEHGYRSRVGRPPKHDWEEGLFFAEKLFTERGDFADSQNQMAGWKTETDFARAIMEHMSGLNNGIEPPFSSAKAVVSKFINNKRSIRK